MDSEKCNELERHELMFLSTPHKVTAYGQTRLKATPVSMASFMIKHRFSILAAYINVIPLKPEAHANSVLKFSPYLTGNTLRLRYKSQPVNAV
jgi:hypothetical protein